MVEGNWRVNGELSESFPIGVRVREGCVMSPCLSNIFMREMKAKVENIDARLKMNGIDWAVVVCLFADNTGCLQ